VNAKFHNFSGISIDIGEENKKNYQNCSKEELFFMALEWAWQQVFWQIDRFYKTNKIIKKYRKIVKKKCGRGSFGRF